ncbi:uncharacterized protein LOC120214991 [Hibiscus syriacus]|uniref:uncharacterized protein LOC120214991 n=1 Tax=Hibiscus syriacus TaxID=106335 RepID=UPI0019234E2E|nr:uncharacterized protein LOC120214991 [Hibiscus syriacus]
MLQRVYSFVLFLVCCNLGGMEREDEMKLKGDTKEKMFQIYTDFLTGVAKLDELVAVGGRLLTGFQQGLEFLRRPPINEVSNLIENVLKAKETKRLKSYLEAGCINNHDCVHNMSKCKFFNHDRVHNTSKCKFFHSS